MKEIIAELATQLGNPDVTAEAIRQWRRRSYVPHKYWFDLLDLAERKRVPLDRCDLDWRQKPKPKKQRRAAA